jgi:predicted ester cyclase
MSEANKQLAKRWFEEVWNKGRREAIPEILSPDAEIRESGELVKGPEGFYPFFDRMQAAFSDIHVTFQDAIAEGDMVCLRWSCAMKHTGSGLGIPPTQKTLATTGMTMVRVANGRFVAGHARSHAADQAGTDGPYLPGSEGWESGVSESLPCYDG